MNAMVRNVLGLAIAAGILALVLGAGLATQPDSPARPAGGMNVEASMKQMNRTMRQLRSNIENADKRSDNLRSVQEMQRACLAARMAGAPQGILNRAKDDAGKSKVADQYQKHLLSCMRAMVDLEQAITDGKLDAAKTQLDALGKMRDEGHDAVGLGDDKSKPK